MKNSSIRTVVAEEEIVREERMESTSFPTNQSFHDPDQLFRESFFFLSVVCTYSESESVSSDDVKSMRSLLCNERFTSEIRMARRKNISGVSMIVLLIPRATLSADENCKLPVTIFCVRYVCRQTCVYTRTHTEKKLGVA